MLPSPKCTYKKTEIPKGGGHVYGSLRGWGVTHSGISKERGGGLKNGSRPLLGMDIFWNFPMPKISAKSLQQNWQFMVKVTVHLQGVIFFFQKKNSC